MDFDLQIFSVTEIPALGTQEPIIDFGSDELQDEIFIDNKSGKQFRLFKYFDHEVIQDVETGWINAGTFVRNVNPSKNINYFYETDDYENALKIGMKTISLNNGSENRVVDDTTNIHSYVFRCYMKGYGKRVQGTFVPFKVFQLIALWADAEHKIEVLELLERINTYANLVNKSAYDVLNSINHQLQEEIIKLKQGKSDLEDQLLEQILDKEFLTYDVSKLQAQVKDLNTPINQSIQPSSIYASPVGDSHFQLRFSRESISKHSKVKNLKHVELINAKDVLEMTRKELKKNNETSKLNGKVVLPSSKINQTFDLISKIKEGNIKLPTKEEVHSFIDKSILELKLKRLTPQVKGKIFELEQLKQRNFIPWSLLPKSFLGEKNEQSRDCGIDGIKFHENSIEEIVQIKFHNKPSYLSSNEIQTFMNKCQQERYKNIKKRLILHGCKLGRKLRAEIESRGITIDMKVAEGKNLDSMGSSVIPL